MPARHTMTKPKAGTIRNPDKHREGYVTFTGQGAGVGGRDGYSVPEKFSQRIESLLARENDSLGIAAGGSPAAKIYSPPGRKIIPHGVKLPPIHERLPRHTKAVDIYLVHGWHFKGQHMITIGYAGRDVTNEDLAIELRKTCRCYCAERCLDPDSYGRDDDTQIAEILKVRMVVAQANGIPTDGTDKHEAQIDAALTLAKD